MFKFIIKDKNGTILRKIQYETEELGMVWIKQAFEKGLLGKEYDVEMTEVLIKRDKMCEWELAELNQELLRALAEKEEGDDTLMKEYLKLRSKIKAKYK